MYWLTKLSKYRTLVALVLTLVMGFAFVVPSFASDAPTTTFGLSYGAATGLGEQDVRTTISKIINVALGLLGIVAVVIVLMGGFQIMTAGGNEEKVGEGRKMIFAGIIGLAIILSAFAIAKFVLQQLYIATTNSTDVSNL